MSLNFEQASNLRDAHNIKIPEEKRMNLIDIMSHYAETGVLDLEFSVPKPISSLIRIQLEIAWQG